MHKYFKASGLTCLALLLQCGCGGSDLPELGYVEGYVKLDGKPLPNVVLTFQPDKARPSYGRTDEDGWYELIYTDDNPGAVIGNHIVRISSADAAGGAEDDGSYEENYEDGGSYEDGEQPEESRGEKIPRKYNRDSELARDVKAGDNEFNFDLTSGD